MIKKLLLIFFFLFFIGSASAFCLFGLLGDCDSNPVIIIDKNVTNIDQNITNNFGGDINWTQLNTVVPWDWDVNVGNKPWWVLANPDTNAQTVCAGSEYLAGDGTCKTITHTVDTNAQTACPAGQVLTGNGTCSTFSISDTNAQTACAAGEFLTGSGTCDPIAGRTFVPQDVTLITGSLNGGDVNSLQIIDDDLAYAVDEVVATPGLVYDLNFIGVTEFNQISFHVNYNGSAGHTINVDLYNFDTDTFDTFGQIVTDGLGFAFQNYNVTSSANYIDADGNTSMRVDHVSPGNINHDLNVDYVALRLVFGGLTITDHGSLAGLGDDDHIQYVNRDGSRAMTGDWNMGSNSITKLLPSTEFIDIDVVRNGAETTQVIDIDIVDTSSGNFNYFDITDTHGVGNKTSLNITSTSTGTGDALGVYVSTTTDNAAADSSALQFDASATGGAEIHGISGFVWDTAGQTASDMWGAFFGVEKNLVDSVAIALELSDSGGAQASDMGLKFSGTFVTGIDFSGATINTTGINMGGSDLNEGGNFFVNDLNVGNDVNATRGNFVDINVTGTATLGNITIATDAITLNTINPLDNNSIVADGNFGVSSLDASKLVYSNSSKNLSSVSNLSTWIAGTANEIEIADDGDGTATIGIVTSPTLSGTNITGVPAASILAGTFGTGDYTFSASTPTVRLTSTKNGDWLVDQMMTALEFYGSDTSAGGVGVKGRINMESIATFGSTHHMNFYTAETSRMKIYWGGGVYVVDDLSVGTATQSAAFTVQTGDQADLTTFAGSQFLISTGAAGSGNYGPGIIFSGAAGAVQANRGASITSIQDTADTDSTGLTFNVHGVVFDAPRVEAMRISSGGLVGIGTPTPGFALDVDKDSPSGQVIAKFQGTSASDYIRIAIDADAAEDSQVSFMTAGTTLWSIGNDATNDSFNIETGAGGFATPAMTILSTGVIGIGTNDPTEKVTIENTSSAQLALRRNDITMNVPGLSIGELRFKGGEADVDVIVGEVSVVTTEAWTATSSPTYMAFETTNIDAVTISEKMRITSEGDVELLLGNLIGSDDFEVGTATTHWKYDDTTSSNITANALVGIGLTTLPPDQLTVTKTSAGALATAIRIQSTSSTAGTETSLDMRAAGSDTITGRMSNKVESDGTRSVIFSAFSGTLQERMKIQGGGNLNIPGNVKIGGAIGDTPAANLEVGDASSTFDFSATRQLLLVGGTTIGSVVIEGSNQAELILDDSGGALNEKIVQLKNVGGVTSIAMPNDAGSARLTNIIAIDNTNGDVGIGIDAPDGTLHVHTATAGAVAAAASFDDLIVESSGNTGMSIFSPNASGANIAFGSPAINVGASIGWNHDGGVLTLTTRKAGADIAFNTGSNVEKMRLYSTGNLEVTGDFLLSTGAARTFKVDQSAAATAGDALTISAGQPGAATSSGSDSGLLTLSTFDGADGSGSEDDGGNGGNIVIASGDGGDGGGSFDGEIGGNGGNILLNPGDVGSGDFIGEESGSVIITLPTGGDVQEGQVIINGLPTSDPSIAGALYSDAGTIKISAG